MWLSKLTKGLILKSIARDLRSLIALTIVERSMAGGYGMAEPADQCDDSSHTEECTLMEECLQQRKGGKWAQELVDMGSTAR